MAAHKPCWRWVILISAFLSMFAVGFVVGSMQYFYKELLEQFEESPTVTAGPISAFFCVGYIVGPLTSWCIERSSQRVVAMVTGALLSLGFATAAFAENIIHVYVSFAISGIGMASVQNCCAGIITFYFEKNRNVTLGLIFAALSLGSVCAPFSMKELLENYSYMEACIFIAAFELHIVVFSSLLRPLKQFKYSQKQMVSLDLSIQSSMTVEGVANLGYTSTYNESFSHHDAKGSFAAGNENPFGISRQVTERSPQSGNDSFKECHISSITEDNITHADHSANCVESQTAQPSGNTASSIAPKASILDSLKLLMDVTFLTVGLDVIGWVLAVSATETGLVALTTEKGIPADDSAVLLTFFFTTDTVFRGLLGFALDRPLLKPHLRFIYAFLSVVHGGGAIMFWFAGSYLPLFYIAGCAMNLAKGSLLAQQYSVLMDLFGKDKFQSSIGMTHFLMGIGFLSGPLILGAMKEAFSTFAAGIAVSGIIGIATGTWMLAYLLYRKKTTGSHQLA